MLNRKTTFVVGAGASCELGLPSGEKLKDDIRDVLGTTNEHVFHFTDEMLLENLRRMFSHLNSDDRAELQKMAAAAERIRRGLPMAQSIDNYLHTHQQDDVVRRVGMGAIARVILREERNSHLFGSGRNFYAEAFDDAQKSPNLEHSDLQNSWYVPLARLLFSMVPKSEPQRIFQNVRFVVFNYDRCLEEFLWLALQAYFDLSGENAALILSDVDFIHPYGSLGPLPWQEINGAANIPLGGAKGIDCFQVGKSLQTFTESVNGDTGAFVANAVSSAEILLLLGFGYLEQNLQLLVPEPLGSKGARLVIGTAYGIAQPSYPIINRHLERVSAKYIEPDAVLLEPGKCFDLFRNYGMHLSS